MFDRNTFNQNIFTEKSLEIIQAGQFLYQQGWSPATSSNYSARVSAQHIAITASGKHKGELKNEDIMAVNLRGQAINSQEKPSAETLLHTSLYELFPTTGAVLHTHSIAATVLSRYLSDHACLVLQGYELQKALAGQSTHTENLEIPIFENTQDIASLAREATSYFEQNPLVPAYLIRGHGLYTWGENMQTCLRHIEALEFLLQCEVENIKMGK